MARQLRMEEVMTTGGLAEKAEPLRDCRNPGHRAAPSPNPNTGQRI